MSSSSCVDDRLHPRPQRLDAADGERSGDEATQAGVIGRIDVEHVASERRPGKALRDDLGAGGERGLHVLGEPRVVQRGPSLVVADHQPRRMTVGQRHRMHRTTRANLREQAETGRPGRRRPTPRAPRSVAVTEPFFVEACELSNNPPRASTSSHTSPNIGLAGQRHRPTGLGSPRALQGHRDLPEARPARHAAELDLELEDRGVHRWVRGPSVRGQLTEGVASHKNRRQCRRRAGISGTSGPASTRSARRSDPVKTQPSTRRAWRRMLVMVGWRGTAWIRRRGSAQLMRRYRHWPLNALMGTAVLVVSAWLATGDYTEAARTHSIVSPVTTPVIMGLGAIAALRCWRSCLSSSTDDRVIQRGPLWGWELPWSAVTRTLEHPEPLVRDDAFRQRFGPPLLPPTGPCAPQAT